MKKKQNHPIIRRLAKFSLHLPLLGGVFRRWKINRTYAIERQVIKGKHRSISSHRSILFFTVYRAASSFLGGFQRKIVEGAGMTPVDLDGYFFDNGKGKKWEGSGRVNVNVPYQSTGYFYGPFRSFNRGIANIDDYKILLVLRDPRDVIVSAYYSLYSHVSPDSMSKKKLQQRQERREEKLRQSVDEYIINKMNSTTRLTDYYLEYHRELLGKKNVLFLKYEDMVTHFDPWLDRMLEFFELEVSPQLLEEIKNAANFNVTREDVHKHKRQVTPGDYKRKLNNETIEFLNERTKEVLDLFGYALNS